MIAREVHDPGVGFVTITRVAVTPDLQQARVYYTALGDEKARRGSERALGRAAAFLRGKLGARLRLKRTPEIEFVYDESIAGQDRIEQLLSEIRAADHAAAAESRRDASDPSDTDPAQTHTDDDQS